MTITDQKLEQLQADLRAEFAREWQRIRDMRDRLAAEAARIDDRIAAHRHWVEERLAAENARIMFIFDRLRVILASGGSSAEMLAEVEDLRADLAAGRTGVSPAGTVSKLN
jgi:hypothetical protein